MAGYAKQHLVMFGEYCRSGLPFLKLAQVGNFGEWREVVFDRESQDLGDHLL